MTRLALVRASVALVLSSCSVPPATSEGPDRHAEIPAASPVEPEPPRAVGAESPASAEASVPAEAPAPESAPSDPRVEAVRAELSAARAAQAAEDHEAARERIALAVDGALACFTERDDEAACVLLEELARFAHGAGALGPAVDARRRLLEIRVRTRPGDDPELQAARGNLALTIKETGDLQTARALEEQVLEVCTRTLPETHPSLQAALGNLAGTLFFLGDLDGALALDQRVFALRSQTLPDDHPELQAARGDLAASLSALGRFREARALEEKVLAIRTRQLPDGHPDLLRACQNLAATIKALGEYEEARVLEEKVLEFRSRRLPDDHPDLQAARFNLGATLRTLGDLQGARVLEQKVLEVRSSMLPDDHPDLQAVRQNIALTLKWLGDFEAARVLEEKVLAVRAGSLPDDHPELQTARGNLAATLAALGELESARELCERVLEAHARTLPDDHPDLQRSRHNLAATLKLLGDLDGARVLEEKALDVRLRTFADEDPELPAARLSLATTLLGADVRAARTAGADDARRDPAGRERASELLQSLCRSEARAAREAILTVSSREAEERCARWTERLSVALSAALGTANAGPMRDLERPAFAFSETARGAAVISAALTHAASASPEYAALRARLRDASEALARSAQLGTTGSGFEAARREREAIERRLVELSRDVGRGSAATDTVEADAIAAALGPEAVAVAFRRFTRWRFEFPDPSRAGEAAGAEEVGVESLCAFVVRSARAEGAQPGRPTLALVDLGPVAPIEAAIVAWRDGLGLVAGRGTSVAPRAHAAGHAERGADVRRSVIDPLATHVAGAQRVILVLDDVLHLVPFDALPVDAGGGTLLGDRFRIETRATMGELLDAVPHAAGAQGIVGIGDVLYARSPQAPAADVRGSAWAEFGPLPGTAAEVEGLERIFVETFGAESRRSILRGAEASWERVVVLAPEARWLHVATHGWFAPESIRSWSDPRPIDRKSDLVRRASAAEEVREMSPMLLCGLALAGASVPADARERAAGLVTADELSTIDLGHCELAVLSACDTNVGERRGGQGVASLQRALQMAGARSVITSLWKVPDEATKDLMLGFYRRVWIEKQAKGRALWAAKRELRDAKDANGDPRYTLRDWGAWVLTGEPD